MKPEDITFEMANEENEWKEILHNTTQAVNKNKVNLEIQEEILKLAKKKLKGKI